MLSSVSTGTENGKDKRYVEVKIKVMSPEECWLLYFFVLMCLVVELFNRRSCLVVNNLKVSRLRKAKVPF
jgi:hypothetical protein